MCEQHMRRAQELRMTARTAKAYFLRYRRQLMYLRLPQLIKG
jgi:hypothetical protein